MSVKNQNEHLSRTEILICVQKFNKCEQYSVKSRNTVIDPNTINLLKNQIKKESKHWCSTYFISKELLKEQQFPRESNGEYFWKEFKDDQTNYYTSIQLSKKDFYNKLKSSQNVDDLLEIKVNKYEYEFKDDSDFKSFIYRRYSFEDGSFHDALLCSKHTNNHLEIPRLVEEIKDIKLNHHQLQQTRSVIVEWVFRHFNPSDMEDFKIPTYPTHIMDLLEIRKEGKKKLYEHVEKLKETTDKKKMKERIQRAKNFSNKINFEQLSKYGPGL